MAKQKSKELENQPKKKSNQVTITHSVLDKATGRVIPAGSVINKDEAKKIPEQYIKG